MTREPLHIIGEPSAVRRRTLLMDEDLGPGNIDTEEPESTKNLQSDRISFRKMRDELQNSSGAEARGGKRAGSTGVSTCRTASFPTWNMVSCSSKLSHHAFYETSRLLEASGIWTLEQGSENVWREGSSWREGSLEA